MKKRKTPTKVLECSFWVMDVILISICANCFYFIRVIKSWWLIPLMIVALLFGNIIPGMIRLDLPTFRLRMCYHGVVCLRVFLGSCIISIFYHMSAKFLLFSHDWFNWCLSVLVCIFVEAVMFWNGCLSVYLTSVQLGIKQRVIAALCGMIPIANLIALRGMIKTVATEVEFETQKATLNQQRKENYICETKYPILLVHGVFFRDFEHLEYWGRIPEELKKNGAKIFYGNHQSAASVADSAEELIVRIKEIVQKTGCEKVNIIAHSKGGLDCRYAMCCEDAASCIASITTINTPHRGCEFADYLLEKIAPSVQQHMASIYNKTLKKLGDRNPDFIAAVRDLTAVRCRELDNTLKDNKDVYCQSIGSKLNHAGNGKFPLNFSYHLVHYFDGDNDGLVGEKSFSWGENYTYLTVNGKRGISHGDMIDLNRENIDGFDVREFYVQLVADLKNRGF